jgi:hypothetical protein
MGTVNAYAGGGSDYNSLIKGLKTSNLPAYCDAEGHSFTYSDAFDYKTPECLYVVPEQLVTKGNSQVQVATAFLENTYFGWQCGDADSSAQVSYQEGVSYQSFASAEERCEEMGKKDGHSSTLEEHESGQCVCKVTKAVYPIGAEKIVVSFQHSYTFPVGQFGLSEWKGTSTLTNEEALAESRISHGLDTTIKFPDGEGDEFKEAGESISLTVDQWLKAANISLDDINTIASKDASGRKGAKGGDRYPYFRLTGLVVTVLIKYSNGQPSVADQPAVFADVEAQQQMLPWAGPGSERIHVLYPSGSLGQEVFEYVDRYAQGVVFDFEATGRVYKFDYTYLINTLVTAAVMLGVAGTITNFVAFNLLPGGHSDMLNANRFVPVNRKRGFAELGMKTALSALTFASFDPDNNQDIDAEDIVRPAARTRSAHCTQPAHCTARTSPSPVARRARAAAMRRRYGCWRA